ncbi:DUF2164 domain-containing protein [Undibacterium sp. RuTC16W]|uniref:DUF2164 domain-containing protein n=1 Tax=Undibacterium sp. RuTC16W TaxID=3413048 RepID=UPI003BF26B96
MSINIPKEIRTRAISSIERYFQENMDENIGNLAADALLSYFLEEIGPIIYNQAVTDAQQRLAARVQELDFEVHEEEFQYWQKFDRKRK